MFRINMYKIYASLIAIVLLTGQAQATILSRLFCISKKPIVLDMLLVEDDLKQAPQVQQNPIVPDVLPVEVDLKQVPQVQQNPSPIKVKDNYYTQLYKRCIECHNNRLIILLAHLNKLSLSKNNYDELFQLLDLTNIKIQSRQKEYKIDENYFSAIEKIMDEKHQEIKQQLVFREGVKNQERFASYLDRMHNFHKKDLLCQMIYENVNVIILSKGASFGNDLINSEQIFEFFSAELSEFLYDFFCAEYDKEFTQSIGEEEAVEFYEKMRRNLVSAPQIDDEFLQAIEMASAQSPELLDANMQRLKNRIKEARQESQQFYSSSIYHLLDFWLCSFQKKIDAIMRKITIFEYELDKTNHQSQLIGQIQKEQVKQKDHEINYTYSKLKAINQQIDDEKTCKTKLAKLRKQIDILDLEYKTHLEILKKSKPCLLQRLPSLSWHLGQEEILKPHLIWQQSDKAALAAEWDIHNSVVVFNPFAIEEL